MAVHAPVVPVTPIPRKCCDDGCMEEVSKARFDEKRLQEDHRLLDALADPTRLRMIHLLADHEALCVCEIEAAFDVGQPTISHHLKVLREADIVTVERKGTWAYYALNRRALKHFVSNLVSLL